MARKAIPDSVQDEVIVKSRRRCCMCYGLNRDTSLKSGQIAHLDKTNTNNSLDNLCFLCLIHHDEYDSRTSQSKNYTIKEVKVFRAELHDYLSKFLAIPVHFGNMIAPLGDPYAGLFIRTSTDADSAEIRLTPVPDGSVGMPRYYVSGFALWGTHRDHGPNTGDLSLVGTMIQPDIIEAEDYSLGELNTVHLKFIGQELIVEEDNWLGKYGMNVNFIGNYRKV